MTDSDQYPAQTGFYKVKIKEGGVLWQKHDAVRLEVSIGQTYHEGAKMEATLNWTKNRFSDVVVLVNDTLQRFNLMFERGLSEEEAERIAWWEGETWILRHRDLLDGCSLYRWNEWKARPEYAQTLADSYKLYENNEAFRSGVNESIADVWERRVGKSPAWTHDRQDAFFESSAAYILEETAVLAQIYKQLPGISAYPGSFLKLWGVLADCEVPESLQALQNVEFVRIDFQRNKSYRVPMPQTRPASEQDLWMPASVVAHT